MNSPIVIENKLDCKRLVWDVEVDRAEWIDTGSGGRMWQGGLLPAFELAVDSGRIQYVKAAVTGVTTLGCGTRHTIELELGGCGTGRLHCEAAEWGVRFTQLLIDWSRPTRVIALYFGTRLMSELEQTRTPRADQLYWSDWAAEGYCVPAAGSSPTSSFWRSWDMGSARLPLGSFGSAMGTPYAAAFPRPIYAAAMGGHAGWIAIGPGSVPDAPVTLQLQAETAALQYLYREDLWGAPPGKELSRSWEEPLRLAWGASGYDALERLYASFGPCQPKPPHHSRSFLCTWGDFKEGRYDLQAFTKRVAGQTPADMVIMDDSWETYNGSGEPNLVLFPNFEEDLQHIRRHGYELAFWQSMGWIDEPEQAGMTADDLLCGPDGRPRQWNWSGSPLGGGQYHYCLDPSSERARAWIRERTERIVLQWSPAALKLDFGYGFPGPDACVPRNPEYRGERLAVELLRLIGEAAKAVKPDITIIYYGIHPLLHDYTDMINLDDLGDAGDSPAYERIGHNQRCLWATLAAARGMAINTSSGYYWDALGSILLDTAVVGASGLTPGERDRNGKSMNSYLLNRWHAIHTWRRPGCGWKPLWLDADLGGLGGEPDIRSWGRLECSMEEPGTILASLALRQEGTEAKQFEEASSIRFTGHWALISQDDRDIATSGLLAVIPFRPGTLYLQREYRRIHTCTVIDGRLQRIRTVTRQGPPDTTGNLTLSVDEAELQAIAGFLIE